MYTTNTLQSGSKAIATNSFLPINFTFLVIKSIFLLIWDLYYKFQAQKSTLALLINRKNILKTTSGLILANKKLSLKNFT